MDTKTIDMRTAMRTLEGVVAGREEFVYSAENGCNYEWEGKPSCLVGQVLSELGLPIDVLAEMDKAKSEDYMVDGEIISDASLAEVVPIINTKSNMRLTRDAVAVLREAQARQDDHETWGQALGAAQYLAGHLAALQDGGNSVV